MAADNYKCRFYNGLLSDTRDINTFPLESPEI